MSDWEAVKSQMGDQNMWNINQAFLDQQISQGKSFVFTSSPAYARIGSSMEKEYQYLSSQGYRFTPDESGFYHATK